MRGVLRSESIHRIVTHDRAARNTPLRPLLKQQGADQVEGDVPAEAGRLPEGEGGVVQVPADQRGGLGGRQVGTGRHPSRHRGLPRRH